MARLRKIPSARCLTCRRTSYASPQDRQRVAEHRLEHRRLDRRRRQWREYQDRKRQRAAGDVAGWLHDVGCAGDHYGQRGRCIPIACYRAVEVAA